MLLHPPGSLVIDARTFRATNEDHAGDVGGATVFEYHEDDNGLVWARYSGGDVALGHLSGRRDDRRLEFRYSHITADDTTASGRCATQIEVLADGRLRLHES